MEISIILPVYNKAKYIESILSDIAAQSFNDFECIIIDDGSTDASGKLCDDFAACDNRFCVVHIQNGGVSHARNVGLERATGQYITFIDADDHVEADYLLRLYSDIIDSQADMVIAGMLKYWKDGRLTVATEIPYAGLYSMEKLITEFAKVQKQTGIYGFSCGKLISKAVVSNIQFSEWLNLAEDFEFYLRVYPRIKTIYFEEKCKYHYLQEAENSSAIVESDKIDYLAQLKLNLEFRDFLRQAGGYYGDNLEIVEKLLTDYAFFSIFYCQRKQIPAQLKKVHEIVLKEQINTSGTGLIKKLVLFCIRKNRKTFARNLLQTYDWIRWLKRRV